MTTGVQFGQIHHGECEKLDLFQQIIWLWIYFSFCLRSRSIRPTTSVLQIIGCSGAWDLPGFYWLIKSLHIFTYRHSWSPLLRVEMRLNYTSSPKTSIGQFHYLEIIFFFFLNQPSLFLAASHNFLLAYEFTSRRFDFFAVSECTDSRMLCDYDTTLWQYGEEVNSHRGTFWNKPLFKKKTWTVDLHKTCDEAVFQKSFLYEGPTPVAPVQQTLKIRFLIFILRFSGDMRVSSKQWPVFSLLWCKKKIVFTNLHLHAITFTGAKRSAACGLQQPRR